jgi:hypothetical protein
MVVRHQIPFNIISELGFSGGHIARHGCPQE